MRSMVVVGFILPTFTCSVPPSLSGFHGGDKRLWVHSDPFQVSALGHNECHPQVLDCYEVRLIDQQLFHGKQPFESHVGFF